MPPAQRRRPARGSGPPRGPAGRAAPASRSTGRSRRPARPAGTARSSKTRRQASSLASAVGRAALTPQDCTWASGSGSRSSSACTASSSYRPRDARRVRTRHARSRSSAASRSRSSKCSGLVAEAARVRSAAARWSVSPARRAATSATWASRRGTSTVGLHCSAAWRASAKNGSTTPGLRSVASTPRTHSRKSPVDSSALASMSHAVETAPAREIASGRCGARASIASSEDSSVRTAANVRSPSLSRCRSASGRSTAVDVPVVSTTVEATSSTGGAPGAPSVVRR